VVVKVTEALIGKADVFIAGRQAKGFPERETIGGNEYYRFKFKHWQEYVMKCLPLIKETSPDIIQVENRPRYVQLLRSLLPFQKIILSLHSTAFISPPGLPKDELKRCVRMADRVVVNSEFLKEIIIQRTGCTKDKVFVNHLGVDIAQFRSKWLPNLKKSRNAFKKIQNLESRKVLLYVGRLRKMKGIHHLLNVMPELIKKQPDICLVIVGSASYSRARKTKYVLKLEETAERFPGHVKFIPFIPHTSIQQWFQLADIVYVPSTGKEAFGLVNVEAMACGVPVIASKAGGMKEIIEHGKTGYLIELNQLEAGILHHTEALLSNLNLQKELGGNALLSVHRHFTWDRCAERLFDLYLREIQ
jgi:spore coat protein SA